MTVTPVPDACTIDGTGKDDVLRGTYRRDVICGAAATSYGRGANDLLRGDEGDDRLFGGAGTDLPNGGSG
jgi:Ca2+-binding RTX toxin-like protein